MSYSDKVLNCTLCVLCLKKNETGVAEYADNSPRNRREGGSS